MGNKHTNRRRRQRRRKRELPNENTLAWFPPPGYVVGVDLAYGRDRSVKVDPEWQLKLLEEKKPNE